MLGIGRTHLENVRNHLATNGIIVRVHGNIKRMPRWKTKITIDITVATAVKNFLENYAEIHGLPSPGRNVNRILSRLHYYQPKRVINRSIVILLQVSKMIAH